MFEGALNPSHVIIVLVIALLLFGPKRLPELGKAIGGSIREFKGSFDGTSERTEQRSVEAAPTVHAETAETGETPRSAPPAA